MNTLNGLQSSLASFQNASNQLIQASTPQNATDTATAPTQPTVETAVVNLKNSEQMSEANIKALKTEDQMIGRLLDIMA